MSMTERASQHLGEQRVTANPLDPGRGDWPVEEAQAYMRRAIFNSPEVINHLLALADLREAWQSSPRRGELRAAFFGGEPVSVDASLGEQMRYRRALEASPLCALFSADYLDRRISVIRDRLRNGFWGLAEPPGDMGARYRASGARTPR
jgi:hypothetical protein